MNENWNTCGLILEGICGTGKTTILRSLLRSERFTHRSFHSAIVLSEHQTQRVLERRERESGLTVGDNIGLLDQHASYLESVRDRLDEMRWCQNGRTNMRVAYVLERFHLTHVCHYRHIEWKHVEPMDRRLANLNCKLCLLTIPDEALQERIISSRDAAWRGYLSRYGDSDDEIIDHYARQQDQLRALLDRSALDTLILDTAGDGVEQTLTRVLDFWGATKNAPQSGGLLTPG